ncbi:MAG: hypothetical protein WC823_00245 [Parcubacteria group bacterium]|jgi:hypothetical protein
MSFLGNFYQKAKKKLYDTEQGVVSGLSNIANSFRNDLSGEVKNTTRSVMDYAQPRVQSFQDNYVKPVEDFVQKNPTPYSYVAPKVKDYSNKIINYANNPTNTPGWMKKVDSGLKSFSQKAENVPKFDFAEKINNPVGKFAAEIPQTMLNIPSRTVSAAFKDYGKVKVEPSYLVKRGAEAANIGVDVGSLFAGGGTVKNLAQKGLKSAGTGVMDVVKQGARRGAKEGLLYGGASGALSGAQEGNNLREQGRNAIKGAAGGAVIGAAGGAVLGGAISGGGKVVGDEIRGISKDISHFKNPYAKRVVTKMDYSPNYGVMLDGKPQRVPNPNTARKVVETVKMPFQPQSITGKLLTARPGMNIQDVNALKPKVMPDLDARIAQKRAQAESLVNKQIDNQKQGLPVAEKGFVAPQSVVAPEKKPLPSIEEYVNAKNAANVKKILDDQFASFGPDGPSAIPDWIAKKNKIQEDVRKKIAYQDSRDKLPSIDEYVNKKTGEIITPKEVFQEKPYNRFQQKAFDAKADRMNALGDVLNYPNELRQIGYKKNEIEKISKEQAERILKLANLGYPKNAMPKDLLSDQVSRTIKNKVSWGQMKDYHGRMKALNTNFLEDIDPEKLNDINSLMGSARDVYRNVDVVFGDNSVVKKKLLDPLDQSKGDFIDEQSSQLGQLWDGIVEKYGIKEVKTFFGFKYGDRSSEYVQKVGENVLLRPLKETDLSDDVRGQINFTELKNLAEKTKADWRMLVGKKLEELPDIKEKIILTQLKEAAPKSWNNIVNAVSWFRNKYDDLLPELNKVREATYPTHPLYPETTKVIPFRKNYFPHSLERDGITGLKNLFDTPSSIDPSLAVSSEYSKPKSKFLGFAQRRTGDKTEYDAVKGMKNYIRDFAFAKHIDPQIQKFRGMNEEAKELAKNYKGALPERIGLAEELSKKLDPIQQITDATDSDKIQKVLMDYGVSDGQSDWMSKELANISNYDKVKNFIKSKTEKNKEDVFGRMEPKAVAEGSENKLNNFLKFLDNYANDLAGKTNPFDRPNQDAYARKSFKILRAGLSRIKSNAVVGNVGSAVSQFFSLPPGIASAGVKNTTKGIKDSLVGVFRDDLPIKNSNFLKERYFDGTSRFDETFLSTPKKFASWMMTFGDEVSAKIIWNSHYRKALSENIPNPVNYADDWTRRMVGGRGVGEVPLMQKSLMYQITNPFNLEVTNYWYSLRDLAKHDPKKLVYAKKLVEAFVIGHIMNRVVKEIRGSDVIFDPIQAMIDGYQEYEEEDNKKLGLLKAGGRMAGEFLSNAPGLPSLPTGQTIANMYDEYGGGALGSALQKITGSDKPILRKTLFGEGDPTRFGSGGVSDVITGGLQDPLYKIIPPFGGSQIKKTYEGTKSIINGFAENAAGKVMSPIERDVPNIMKGVLFGKNALNEVQDYFKNDSLPLSDLQTEKYKLMGNSQDYFNKIANERKTNREKEALKGGKTIASAGELSDGMSQLSNGSIYVKSLDKEFKTAKEASMAIAMDDLASSEDNFRDLNNGWVLRKGEDGNVVKQRRSSYDSGLNTAKLSGYKKNKDLENWKKTADTQLDLLGRMMMDPNIDDFDKAKIQNSLDTLEGEYEKYAGYGGFTKGKKAAKVEEKYRYPLVDVEMMKIKNLIAGTGGTKFRMTRKPMPLILRKAPVVHRTRRR